MRILLLASAILVGCTTAKAEDRRITLINQSSMTIVQFHASDVGRSLTNPLIFNRL